MQTTTLIQGEDIIEKIRFIIHIIILEGEGSDLLSIPTKNVQQQQQQNDLLI